MAGTLIIAGSGIKAVGHLTADACHWIRSADKVLHVVADAVTERAILEMNPRAESMRALYGEDRRRRATYDAMVNRILAEVRTDAVVCAVFYGHPGVFVAPSHEAIHRARAEGHTALMLPGISAEDCLIADLGLDPARIGWHTFEATDFLIHRRAFDPASPMVLWQIGAIGNLGLQKGGFGRRGLAMLIDVLGKTYGLDHEVVVYEAAVMPTCDSVIHRAPLGRLLDAPVTTLATLYVPPCKRAALDLEMVAALGLSPSDFGH